MVLLYHQHQHQQVLGLTAQEDAGHRELAEYDWAGWHTELAKSLLGTRMLSPSSSGLSL
jgi:hypothetical protein